MTKTELREQYEEEVLALKAMNAAYKSMLMKVQQYGLPLTKEETLINNGIIQEVVVSKKLQQEAASNLKKS